MTGDYFLETQAATANSACNNFNVKMTCSGGAETASPSDSDPQGFSVDTKTGAITGTPKVARDGYTYKMRLRAVDAAEVRSTVGDWKFSVRNPPAFKRNPLAEWSMATEGKLASKYHVAETHLLPKPRLDGSDLLQSPAGDDFTKVVYLLTAKAAVGNPKCAVDATETISALTDVATGEGAINIKCEGNYTATLAVRDGAGAELTLRNWTFQVLRRDTAVPEYGPGGRGCSNGVRYIDVWLLCCEIAPGLDFVHKTSQSVYVYLFLGARRQRRDGRRVYVQLRRDQVHG